MSFKNIRLAIQLCGDAGVTCCVWGHRGVGKSAMVRQLAEQGCGEKTKDKDGNEVPLPMGFIDYRLGQIEASDLRGLPDKQEINGVVRTVYRAPSDLPIADMTAQEIKNELDSIKNPVQRKQRELELQPHYENGYLFLDEPNRAQDDVLQAVFQLILDRRIGQYKLPDGWRIVMAANYMEGGSYITNNFSDAAFLDRFCHLKLITGETTLDDWLAFMAANYGEDASQVMDYCATNMTHLDGKVEGTLGFDVQPSRRSWESVTRVTQVARAKDYSEEIHLMVCSGLVGMECANGYIRYSCPIKPRDIIKDGVKKHKDTLVKLGRGQLMGLSWGLVSMTQDKMTEKNVVNTCLDFAEVLLKSTKVRDKDVVVSFCRALIGDEGPMVACLTNKDLARIINKLGSSNTNLFFQELQARKELHKLVADAGWGRVGGK